MTNEEIHAELGAIPDRVQFGFRWYKRHYRGRLNNINLDSLFMKSGCYCIIGQGFPEGKFDFWGTLEKLSHRLGIGKTLPWAVKRGFVIPLNIETLGQYSLEYETYYRLLQVEWVRVLTEYKEKMPYKRSKAPK